MTRTQPGRSHQLGFSSIGLESKVPPAALFVAAAALMWIASRQAPAFDFTLPARVGCSVVLVFAGALAGVAGVVSFRRAKTTVNPTKPETASALVASGIYRYSRNPMYLGLVLILLGWALFLSNALALLVLAAFALYLDRFQIRPEERALLSVFGQDFKEYRARARRWL